MPRTIKSLSWRACAPLATCVLLWSASPNNQGTLRIISRLSLYSQPGGLVEGFPGLFFSVAQLAGTASFAAFSTTEKGLTTTLTSFPSGYNFSGYTVSGPNGRLYNGVGYQGSGNMFSVAAKPGVLQYPAQPVVPGLTQGIPGGAMLGRGTDPVTGWNIATCNQDGIVTPIYSFPGGDYIEYPVIYASDGNYYTTVSTLVPLPGHTLTA